MHLCLYGSQQMTPEALCEGSPISSVYIENGVIGIGAFTFYNCGELVSVYIPTSVYYIGRHAFSKCSTLQDIDLKNVVLIEDYAFFGTSLRSITIPETVSHIGKCAFQYSTVEVVYLQSSHTIIAENAFPPKAKIIYKIT